MNERKIIMAIIFVIISLILTQTVMYSQRVEANVDRVRELKENSKIQSQEEIAQELIRFHVLANSDSEIDQDIKIRVRDEVLKEVVPLLDQSCSLEETRDIIEDKKQRMVDVAQEVLIENGKNYGAIATLGDFSFPTKYYGEFSLPAGNYEALRIVLGEGRGSNWWCVMFPPLCFINIEEEEDKGEQENSDTIEDLIEPAANIREDESNKEEPIEREHTPVIRWRIIELFQSMFK